jgi:hypothetical protein
MIALSRFRVCFVLLTIAGIVVTAAPRAAEAATRHVSTSTYSSHTKCDDDTGESTCTTLNGPYFFTLLQVNGKNFTANTPVLVTVTELIGFSTVSSGMAIAGPNGTFTFKTPDVEVCASGTPIMIQAYDVAAQRYSDTAFLRACDF